MTSQTILILCIIVIYYCKTFFVVPEEGEEPKWVRDCKHDIDNTLGCSQHKWMHDGHETLVDECVCNTDLCNREMESTTKWTTPTTTTDMS